MADTQLDDLDHAAADAFDGYIVRKDLVRKFARQYPVPTYVCEFLLGRYCASTSEEEIQEGLQIVERMLTGGFYAEIDLNYDALVAQERNGRPFAVAGLRPIQLSKREVLEALYEGRRKLTTAAWKDFLLRSIGLEPTQ